MQPSKYQQEILDWLINGKGNGCCNAVAGSGKSTTLKLAAKALQEEGIKPSEIKVIVFGKANSLDLIAKFGREWNQSISTCHSAGWSMVKRYLNIAKSGKLVNGNKYKKIAQDFNLIARRGLPKGDLKRGSALDKDADFIKLIELTRLTNQEPSREIVEEICDHFEMPDVWEFETVAEAIADVLDEGERQGRQKMSFDFTDMIWLPVKWEIGKERWFKPYKFVLVDECQDLNAAQLELSLALAGKDGRLLYVGDPNQAIMGFAGADCDSYSNILRRVRGKELPLSICYRCPSSHIDLVKKNFINIPIEASDRASEGRILQVTEKQLFDNKSPGALKDDDLVLCRKTAPLVSLCIKLISRGIAATVKGRSIGDGLKRDLEDINKMGFPFKEFGEAIAAWQKLKIDQYKFRENKEKLEEQLKDKCDAIRAIYESQPQAQNIKELGDYIDDLFSDDHSPITLSTVHRAKGLEADRVFILKPDDMPMTWRDQKEWQRIQEDNILYVALTRSKSDLFILGKPDWLKLEEEKKKDNCEPLAAEKETSETLRKHIQWGRSRNGIILSKCGEWAIEKGDRELVTWKKRTCYFLKRNGEIVGRCDRLNEAKELAKELDEKTLNILPSNPKPDPPILPSFDPYTGKEDTPLEIGQDGEQAFLAGDIDLLEPDNIDPLTKVREAIASLDFETKCELFAVLEKEVIEEREERVKLALCNGMGGLSNRAIALNLGFVSDVTVGRIRKKMISEGAIAKPKTFTDARGRIHKNQ